MVAVSNYPVVIICDIVKINNTVKNLFHNIKPKNLVIFHKCFILNFDKIDNMISKIAAHFHFFLSFTSLSDH